MADVKIKLGDKTIAINNGDLQQFARPSNVAIIFNLAQNELVRFGERPLAELTANQTSLTGSLTVGQDAEWSLGAGGNVTFGFSAGAQGELAIRKTGEILRYREGEDEERETIVKVPAGFACVVVKLKVSLGVEGGAAFSSGNFGVSANVGAQAKFNLINYKCFPLTTKVEDALQQAFEHFVLPFKTAGFGELNDHDFVEYEFIGKLGLGLGASVGLGGAFFGGRSTAELMQSFKSPIGSVIAGVNPTFGANAEFAVNYEHEDAFRIVVGRVRTAPANQLRLFVFKLDQSALALRFNGSIALSAGAQFRIQSRLTQLIDEAAKQIFADLPAGPVRDDAIRLFKENLNKIEHKRQLEKYVKDANARVAALFDRVNDQRITLEVLHERITTHTALFNYVFDLNRAEALNDGYAKAVAGDYVAAMKVPGVSLLPGSFVEDVFIRRTSLNFQFFDLFKVFSLTEYFTKTAVVYAGEGVFRLRFTTGVLHEDGHVGHGRHAEVFFTADAATKEFQTVDDLDVKLHFVLTDSANRKAARQTADVLAGIGKAELERFAQRIVETAEADATLNVKVSCVFDKEAFARLQTDDFAHNDADHPPPLPQTRDRRNWEEFVRAVEEIKEQGFQTEGFPDLAQAYESWMLFNRTVNDQEGSQQTPNRRRAGNIGGSGWPIAWINVGSSSRQFMKVYLEAGRGFMNFCDDLKHLAHDVDDIHTDEQYRRLLKSLSAMIQQDFKVWFTKTTLLALCRLLGGRVAQVNGPPEDAVIGETFAVSFEVVG